MKTPREVLLARHTSMKRRLDAMRRAVVAEHTGPAVDVSTGSDSSWRQWVWGELIWPCRRAWAGLAVVWLAILGLNLSAGPDGGMPRRTTEAQSSAALREVRIAVGEQARWRAELLESDTDSESQKPAAPGPRSEFTPGVRLGRG
jgi:hypothetical protein